MLSTIIVIPGSLTLIPELGGGDSAAAQLRADIASALVQGGLSVHHAVTVVGSQDKRWRTGLVGSFRAWGADVTVSGGHWAAELVARYFLDAAAVPVEGGVAKLGEVTTDAAVLVADGSAGMTPRAPLGLVPEAEQADAALQRLLLAGTPLPGETWLHARGVIEPGMWVELAAQPGKWKRQLLAAEHSTGVGRYIAVWTKEDK